MASAAGKRSGIFGNFPLDVRLWGHTPLNKCGVIRFSRRKNKIHVSVADTGDNLSLSYAVLNLMMKIFYLV